jgi:hypothetical protein
LTGGFDEIIRIYDLKKKKEVGQLVGHEGNKNDKMIIFRNNHMLENL